ncbi:MAG: hypothetical protein ACXWCZ_07315 [Flavisolibacter sp.]
MHKLYLLLRNNKKQGPYSLDELLQQSLKPFDLVWVEGKSAGWKYPTEIDALKSYVAQPAIETNTPEMIAAVQSPPAIQLQKSFSPQPKSQPQPKPHKVFVSLPAGKTMTAPVAEEDSLSKKLEKKAEELYQRAQAFAEQKSREKNMSPVDSPNPIHASKGLEIDTKYSRSLEDIKDEYTGWLLEQKRNKKRPVYKTSLTIAAIVLLLAVGYTAAKIVFKKDDDSAIAKQTIPPIDNEKSAINKPEVSVSNTNTNSVRKKTTEEKIKAPVVSRKKQNADIVSSKMPETKPPVVNNEPKPVQVANPVFLPEQVKITGQYSANKKGIPDFDITVQNNSNQKLRFVAVDIFYYRKDGSLDSKKTLYFNKVAPNSIMTLIAPGNSKADEVIFKMGLMSNEKGELYYTKL